VKSKPDDLGMSLWISGPIDCSDQPEYPWSDLDPQSYHDADGTVIYDHVVRGESPAVTLEVLSALNELQYHMSCECAAFLPEG
jgi:hypothetical protein